MNPPWHQTDCTQQFSNRVVSKATELDSCELPNLPEAKVIFFDRTHEVAEDTRGHRDRHTCRPCLWRRLVLRECRMCSNISQTLFFMASREAPSVCSCNVPLLQRMQSLYPFQICLAWLAILSYMICHRMSIELSLVLTEREWGQLKTGRASPFRRAETLLNNLPNASNLQFLVLFRFSFFLDVFIVFLWW